MSRMIFVNLPVSDLARSMEFFTKLGFTFNPQFTDENAACMVIDDNIFAMLLVQPFFESFTKRETANGLKSKEVIVALSASSRQEVDDLVDNALAAGAHQANETDDQGFMYTRSFNDLDGHMWETVYMDMEAAAKAMQ